MEKIQRIADFSKYQREEHVSKSLILAKQIAYDNPINAGLLIRTIVRISKESDSEAFLKLREILSVKFEDKDELNEIKRKESLKIELQEGLFESFELASVFWQKNKSAIWGRDLITMAVLAVKDSSLNELMKQLGLSLEVVQDAWYYFVTSNTVPHSIGDWTIWWNKAGVPTPDQREVSNKNNQSNISSQERKMLIPIIDAGHGGIDASGNYTTQGKSYKFTGPNQHDLEIFEGEINRAIAKKLIIKLRSNNIEFYDLNSDEPADIPIPVRTKKINELYLQNESHFLLSIHANTAGTNNNGIGTTENGFEIYANEKAQAIGLTKIAEDEYKSIFPNRKFRGVRQSDFHILKFTKCPAIIVENLFIDNYDEAQYLLSDQGQEDIANCLLEIILLLNNVPTPPISPKDPHNFLRLSVHAKSDKTVKASEDLLGYRNYSSAISKIIRNNKDNKPFNIGIIAPWGHGKTTLMEFIREDFEPDNLEKLNKREKQKFSTTFKDLKDWLNTSETSLIDFSKLGSFYPTVWFNAWKYQSSDQIWAGIGHAIITQLVEKLSPIEQEKFWFRLRLKKLDKSELRTKIHNFIFGKFPVIVLSSLLTLLFLVFAIILNNIDSLKSVWGAFAGAGGISGAIWTFKNFTNIQSKLRKSVEGMVTDVVSLPDYSDKLGLFHQLTEDLQCVFDILIDKEKPAVIFIDDLDRCSPTVVAEVIEAINLIMVDPVVGDHCYFIFGMDAQIVAASLDIKYKNLEGKLPGLEHTYGSVGWYFLDKFIQIPFIIPIPQSTDKQFFLKKLFDIKEEKAEAEKIKENVVNKVEELKQAIATGNNQKVSEIFSSVSETIKPELRQTFVAERINSYNDDSPEIANQIDFLSRYLSSSPREIKRYINLLRFHNVLHELVVTEYSSKNSKNKKLPDNVKTEGSLITPYGESTININFVEIARWVLISLKWPQLVRWIQWEDEQDLVNSSSPEFKAKKMDSIIKDFKVRNNGSNSDDLVNIDKWRKYLEEIHANKLDWLKDKQLFQVLTDKDYSEDNFEKAIEYRMW